MKRRLNKEISIYSKYDESKNDYYVENCYFYDSADNFITFYIFIEDKVLFLKIECNTGYPFRPPNIFVNNIKYISLLRPTPLFHLYKKFLNIPNCLCCNSILCNWNLNYGCKHILTEVRNNFIIKNRLRRMIYAKKIMNKKFGFEINNLYYFV